MTAGWHGLLGTETQGATWKRVTENDQKIPQQDFWPVFFTLFALLIFIQLFRAALGSALQSMGLPGVLVKRNSATMRGKSQFLLVCHIYYAYVPTHQNLSFKNFPLFWMVTFLLCQSPINILSFKETSLARMTSYFCPYSHIHILSYNFGLLVCFFIFKTKATKNSISRKLDQK